MPLEMHICPALFLDRDARACIIEEETLPKRFGEFHGGRQTGAVRDADARNVESFKTLDRRVKLPFRRLHQVRPPDDCVNAILVRHALCLE